MEHNAPCHIYYVYIERETRETRLVYSRNTIFILVTRILLGSMTFSKAKHNCE